MSNESSNSGIKFGSIKSSKSYTTTSNFNTNLNSDLKNSLEGNQLSQSNELKKSDKYLYFMLAGLLSLTPLSITLAVSDVMNDIYIGYNYSFYCVVPQYLSVLFTLALNHLFTRLNLSMTTKVFISYTGTLVGLVAIPVYTFSARVKTTNFWIIMMLFLMTFIFVHLLQTLSVSISTIYDKKWISIYFKFQPVSNIIIVVLKNIVHFGNMGYKADYILVFGFGVVITILTGYYFTKITKCQNYFRSFLTDESTSSSSSTLTYSEGWNICRYEALGLFFTMFLCYIPWPGIFFTAVPVTLMSSGRYIVTLNTIAAFFDWFGRYFAAKSYIKAWVNYSFGIMFILDLFMISIFFYDWNQKIEGICYVKMPVVAYSLFRKAFGITYYMMHANGKADDRNRNMIGTIMSNILILGVCCGNLFSLSLIFLKG